MKRRFFDDEVKDAQARKVDLKKLSNQASAKEWEEFQDFVTQVDAADEKAQEEEEKEEKELDDYAKLDYRRRVSITCMR